MSASNASPCLFLSHSGADTDAARELKRRLLDSADARAAGLRVWLDKDDLAAKGGDYEGGKQPLEEKELYVLRACGSPSREAPGSTSVWRP